MRYFFVECHFPRPRCGWTEYFIVCAQDKAEAIRLVDKIQEGVSNYHIDSIGVFPKAPGVYHIGTSDEGMSIPGELEDV